jgi:serine/threonine-protein kinase HipA
MAAKRGRVVQDNRGRLLFRYDEAWRAAANAYPLSISMPLVLTEHGLAKIDPFLWGLLADNEIILDHWERKFHVSARNPFALISCVGEDRAGAVQFVRLERFEAILGVVPPTIEWLDDGVIALRLRTLREDHSAWRVPRYEPVQSGRCTAENSSPIRK